MKHDPTRTKLMRIQYSSQLTRLFKKFRKETLNTLVESVVKEQEKRRSWTDDTNYYLETQTTKFILTPSKDVIKRNIRRAYNASKDKARREIPFELGKDMTPLDWESLILLQDINFNRIKDCTDNMRNAITYSCSKGVLEGWGANKIAYEIKNNVDGNPNMGITRCKMIARTEIINAYNQGKMNMYKQAGLTQYEWLTALDERTCEECTDLDGKVFNIGNGQIPPIHPNCRCTTLAVVEKPEEEE
jgi:SPP1 gp7 family putative phage head morphogenesis protein